MKNVQIQSGTNWIPLAPEYIHDTKLKEQQLTTKKLKLLSLSEQRELEKKEIKRNLFGRERDVTKYFYKEFDSQRS